MWPWLSAVLAAATPVLGALMFWAGRRGRAAGAARDEADAAESLTQSVVQLGKRLDQVSRDLWDAQQRQALSEGRALAAEQRAAAAELRAAIAEQRAAASDAEVAQLRTEVAQQRDLIENLRIELARYEAQGGPGRLITHPSVEHPFEKELTE